MDHIDTEFENIHSRSSYRTMESSYGKNNIKFVISGQILPNKIFFTFQFRHSIFMSGVMSTSGQ